jgi:chromosome segregation ATPase
MTIILSTLQNEIETKVASFVRELKAKIAAIENENNLIERELEKVKKDLKAEIDLNNTVVTEKASLEAQVTQLEVKVVTLESKIVDYERLRTKLELNIEDLIKMKNTLEAKLESPQIVSHEATIHEYETKLLNVDEGYRGIIAQLEERVTFLEEDNSNLKAAKLHSDKEFADLIYSARYYNYYCYS